MVKKKTKVKAVPARIADPIGESFDGDDVLRPHNAHFVDKLYDNVSELIDDFKVGDSILGEITELVEHLMEGVKLYPDLRGREKKVIVLKVARRILSEFELDDNTHIAVVAVINYVIPSVIDMIVAAVDGELDLNRKWRKTKKVWNGIMSVCGCCRGCQCDA